MFIGYSGYWLCVMHGRSLENSTKWQQYNIIMLISQKVLTYEPTVLKEAEKQRALKYLVAIFPVTLDLTSSYITIFICLHQHATQAIKHRYMHTTHTHKTHAHDSIQS